MLVTDRFRWRSDSSLVCQRDTRRLDCQYTASLGQSLLFPDISIEAICAAPTSSSFYKRHNLGYCFCITVRFAVALQKSSTELSVPVYTSMYAFLSPNIRLYQRSSVRCITYFIYSDQSAPARCCFVRQFALLFSVRCMSSQFLVRGSYCNLHCCFQFAACLCSSL